MQGFLRSIRSSNRARTTEGGIALIAAMTLAVLYFGLMQLLLVDSSRALEEARRFRARLVAATVAENAAELGAQNLIVAPHTPVNEHDGQGTMAATTTATMHSSGGDFVIEASGETSGVIRQSARVRLQGSWDNSGNIVIEWANHGY